jgi:hypothetical protein
MINSIKELFNQIMHYFGMNNLFNYFNLKHPQRSWL